MSARPAIDASRRVDEPVFLVCSERSGSTLLTHMLDHHPEMAWALALEFAVEKVRAPGEWPPLDEYCAYLETHLVFQRSGMTVDRRLDYVSLVHDFLAQERARKRRPVVGAAVHRNFDRLPWLFPSCRFVHLVRDGRDVSHSLIGLGIAGNVWRGADRWSRTEAVWDRLRETLPAERVHEVRYEALVGAPEETLGAICEFIGVPYSDRMLAYPADTNYGPVDPTLAGRWRKNLAPRDVRIVEAVAGSMLAARGYAPSGLAPLRIGAFRRAFLREHDRFHRVRFRVAHDGFWLTATDFAARHLGLRGAARATLQRRNAIEARTLR